MPTEYVSDSATNFFCGLLALVNEEFATFHHIIMQELKCLNCKLRFEYKKLDLSSEDMLHVPESSGTTQIKPVNVYNINNGDNVKKLR
jgi:hypothetical protein